MQIQLPPETPTAHPGLLLDRYLLRVQQIEKKERLGPDDWRRLTTCVPSSVYEASFKRWEKLWPDAETRVLTKGTVAGRFITGLGAESVFEINIRLHHTYGVPVIPGNSLKGALRAYLWQAEQRKEAEFLFGTPECAGFAQVHDAWWVPGSSTSKEQTPPSGLDLDVLTPHHQDYYAGASAPTDFDSPVPVNFLTARGSFLFVIDTPTSAWRAYVKQTLVLALGTCGLGAKKSSGYGRFTFGS